MKNIVLIEPNREKYRSAIYIDQEIWCEPLALQYIGAQIKQDHNIKIIHQRHRSNKEILKEITEEQPDLVGFSVYTFTAPNTQKLCDGIKKYNPKIITVMGGYHPSGYPQIVRDRNIDFVVIGEGEITFSALVKALESGKDISEVRGIAYWDDHLRITKPRERIKNLDELAFPLRTKKSIKKYDNIIQIAHSRGCPHRCTFCDSYRIWNRQVNWRSAKNTIEEIKQAKELGANKFYFTDLTFNLNKNRVYELLNEIKKENIDLKYSVMCSPHQIDKGILNVMKETGCFEIRYGIEATEDTMLKTIGKIQKFSETKKILDLTAQFGIQTVGYFMIGYPKDNRESLAKFKETIIELPLNRLRLAFFTPFPTLPLFEEYKNMDLLLTEDFSEYTTDKPVVKCKIPKEELVKIREDIYKEFDKHS
ncbi:MAG: B12-binding domain-containing radical SAM protein [Candidatus Pacearchaeota archaeon]|nr:MAG: B12-binding domain-containing radical SAM protein [Candidatus Pacearchaeota archaeon]